MYLQFISGAVSNGKGFVLTVMDIERCGGRLTATSEKANLTSPGYPYTYFNNLRCIWIITAENENETIALITKSSNINPNTESGNKWDGDMVRVFNGNTTEADQFLGAFNSFYTPAYYSSKDSLLIEFTTEGATTTEGFWMQYTARPEGNCNGTYMIYNTPAYVLSPGYPDSYQSDLECVIMIAEVLVPENMRLDVLSSEMEGNYPRCDNDSVTLFSVYGNDDEDTIGEFCGNSSISPVGPYYSNGMIMKLVFKTGSDTSGKGFRLQVSQSSRPVIPHPTHVCGPRFLNASTYPKFLQSPGYPVISQNNLDCVWTMTASDPKMMVRIDVIDSDVQTSIDYLSCKYSRVTAYNGPSIFNATILFWCGVSRPTLQSTGPAMTVQFQTKLSNDKRGFKLKYFETNETYRCGGTVNVTTSRATILTGPYLNSQDCHWTIHAPANTNIQINVTNVEVVFTPPSPTCDLGYLELYDGTNTGLSTPRRWCGKHDADYISSGNILTARLNSGATNRYRGLQMYLQAGHFDGSTNTILSAAVVDQYITSPNYPFDCPRITESSWKIEGGDNIFQINIVVKNSSLDLSDGCQNDYVEAFDGSDTNAPSLGRWCGKDKPTKTGSSSTMFLKFKSNSSLNVGRGFKILYILQTREIDTGFSQTAAIIASSAGAAGGLIALTLIFVGRRRERARRNKQPLITKKL
ncbi:deleted in malignant brain tumors 1 protein-like isoform X2 [Haliotis rufescens]|nr:deleted in malignant brain tumors 1 protein-like isoform X2 [Haliotis rufescens]